MKKFLAMALAAVMVLALAACGSKNDTAGDTGDAQDAQGGETQKLIVGFDAEFPPFGFIAADGSYDGFDLAMAKELCARLGWEYEAVAIDWNSKDAELSSGTINCIWNGLTITDERLEAYEMSPAYMDNEQVIVVMQDSEIKAKADLAGKTVAAQKDSSGLEALQGDEIYASIKDGVAKEYGNYVDAMTDLEIGRCNAIVMDSIVANYYITMNAKPMVVLEDKMSSEEYGIAFKKGNTALKDAVWGALKELKEEGKIAEISNEWFGRDDMIIIE